MNWRTIFYGILTGIAFALFAATGIMECRASCETFGRTAVVAHSLVLLATIILGISHSMLIRGIGMDDLKAAGKRGRVGCFFLITGYAANWYQLFCAETPVEQYLSTLSTTGDVCVAFGWFFLFLSAIELPRERRWRRLCGLAATGFATVYAMFPCTIDAVNLILGREELNLTHAMPTLFTSLFIAAMSVGMISAFSFTLERHEVDLPMGEQCFSFEGRARRREYWRWSLPVFLVAVFAAFPLLITGLVRTLASDAACVTNAGARFLILGSTLGTACALLLIPVSVRRLHDRGLPSRWVMWLNLLACLPLVGLVALLTQLAILGSISGTDYENDYGSPTKSDR